MDLLSLWLSILLSAMVVWFVSTFFGMPFLHHRNDSFLSRYDDCGSSALFDE